MSGTVFSANETGAEVRRNFDCLLYPVIVGVLTYWFFALPSGQRAIQGLLGDPDNYQRLVQVRDWLEGQSWWETEQSRIDPPSGLQLHWSRLADVPLALAISLLSLFLDYDVAEHLAVLSVPPLLLLVTAIFLGRTAHNLGGVLAERCLALSLFAVPFLLAQFVPGRVDHHGIQLLLFSLALSSATSGLTVKAGAMTAFAVALSLLVGLELVPLLLAIPAWMSLNWLLDKPGSMEQLQGFLVGMVVYLPIFYMLSVNPAQWAKVTHDEIGAGHIVIISVAAIILVAGLRLGLAKPKNRIALLSIAALASILLLLAFPQVMHSPYGQLTPQLQELWIENIPETESAWDIADTDPNRLLFFHLFPVLTLLVGIFIYVKEDRSQNLLLILMVATAGLVLSAWQVRAMAGASIPAALLGSFALAHFWRRREETMGRVRFFAAIVTLNGLFGSLIYLAVTQKPEENFAAARQASLANGCETSFAGADYDRFPAGLVLNGMSSSALILARTHHSVLAAGNHRAIHPNDLAYRMFLSSPTRARELIDLRKIDYLLTCRDAEFMRLARSAPDGLAAAVADDNAPDWLEPLPHSGGKKVLFYAISR